MTIVFEGCRVFDGVSAETRENASVVVEDGRIKEVADGAVRAPADAERVACAGRTLMPGLIDAHFHALLVELTVPPLDDMPASLLYQLARRSLEGALSRGFTTVRDAGGADLGLAMAVERGLIAGPRIFFSGRGLSQTGGHGDMRSQTRFEPCGCAAYHGPVTQVADGVDAVRRAAREELRKGAHPDQDDGLRRRALADRSPLDGSVFRRGDPGRRGGSRDPAHLCDGPRAHGKRVAPLRGTRRALDRARHPDRRRGGRGGGGGRGLRRADAGDDLRHDRVRRRTRSAQESMPTSSRASATKGCAPSRFARPPACQWASAPICSGRFKTGRARSS